MVVQGESQAAAAARRLVDGGPARHSAGDAGSACRRGFPSRGAFEVIVRIKIVRVEVVRIKIVRVEAVKVKIVGVEAVQGKLLLQSFRVA